MAYTAYDKTKPDATTQAGAAFGASTKANLLALRDTVVAGAVQGWNYSYTGTDAGQPATVVWTFGTEKIQETYTWGTDASLTKVAYRYSSNTGTAYDPMADASGNFVHTFTYDGSGNLTASTWGTST